MAIFTAIYGACVLYPAPLRDFLLRLAITELFRARWSDHILEEWTRNVLNNRKDLAAEQLKRTRQLMDQAVPDCLITDYEHLIDSLKIPDPDDRHVLAANTLLLQKDIDMPEVLLSNQLITSNKVELECSVGPKAFYDSNNSLFANRPYMISQDPSFQEKAIYDTLNRSPTQSQYLPAALIRPIRGFLNKI